MDMKEAGFPKYKPYTENKPNRASWGCPTGICPAPPPHPQYERGGGGERREIGLCLVSCGFLIYNLRVYSGDMMKPTRHPLPGGMKIPQGRTQLGSGNQAAHEASGGRSCFWFGFSRQRAAAPAAGAPVPSDLTEAQFRRRSLKGTEDPLSLQPKPFKGF